MADNYEYLTATGVIVPDTSAILANIQSLYRQIFGQDLVVSADTPQGVLMTAQALVFAALVNNNAAIANQINPNIAGGVCLDAIMGLTGVQRTPATRTVVPDVELTGVPGTLISAGSQAQTANGDVFESLSAVTIDDAGDATADFRAVEYGPIACGISDLNQPVSNVLGWETVNNPTAGVLGANTQSDQGARAYRNNTLAFQGVALVEAITSALYNVEGVKSLSFLENTAATTEVIEGITMVAHSVWACVDGGSDLDVAAALLENKSSGAAWNGDEEVDLVEPASGQTYTVKFDRPEEIGILVRVTTTNGNSENIINAILDYADGLISGFAGFIVGADVSPFEIAGAITCRYPAYYISKVEISLTSPVDFTTDAIEIAVDQIAKTQLSYITVVVY